MAVTASLHHVDEMRTLSARSSTAIGIRKLTVKKIISGKVRTSQILRCQLHDPPNDYGCRGDLQVFSPFSGNYEVVGACIKAAKNLVLIYLTQLRPEKG
jgi:hypothetical protein